MKWYFRVYDGFLLIETMIGILVMSLILLTYYQASIKITQLEVHYHEQIVLMELMINIETRRLFNEVMPLHYDYYGCASGMPYYTLIEESSFFKIIRIKDQMEMIKWPID